MPFAPGVNSTFAPKAFTKFLRSTLIVSGIVKINLYPLAAETKANPIPVLPLVGSIIVAPGFKTPLFSAFSIIERATLSFTLPNGLKYSILARSLAFNFFPLLKLFSSIKGVPPTNSVRFFAILLIGVYF